MVLSVGELIRRRREALGLSQRELGDRAHIAQNYVSRLERGEVDLPQRPTIDALASALNLAPRDFYAAAGVFADADTAPAPDALADLLAAVRLASPQAAALLEDVRRREDPEVYAAAIEQLAPVVGATVTGIVRAFRAGEEEGRQRNTG